MKPTELRQLTPEELDSELHRLKEEFFSIKIKHKTQQGVSNPLKIRTLRKDIARILTIKHEKEIRR